MRERSRAVCARLRVRRVARGPTISLSPSPSLFLSLFSLTLSDCAAPPPLALPPCLTVPVRVLPFPLTCPYILSLSLFPVLSSFLSCPSLRLPSPHFFCPCETGYALCRLPRPTQGIACSHGRSRPAPGPTNGLFSFSTKAVAWLSLNGQVRGRGGACSLFRFSERGCSQAGREGEEEEEGRERA